MVVITGNELLVVISELNVAKLYSVYMCVYRYIHIYVKYKFCLMSTGQDLLMLYFQMFYAGFNAQLKLAVLYGSILLYIISIDCSSSVFRFLS